MCKYRTFSVTEILSVSQRVQFVCSLYQKPRPLFGDIRYLEMSITEGSTVFNILEI